MRSSVSVQRESHPQDQGPSEPDARAILLVAGLSIAFVFLTRWPVARSEPLESDEFGYLQNIKVFWFPMQHTLFQAMGRLLGGLAGDAYRGFILLDMACSAMALTSVWWFLRALVPSSIALAAAFLLGVGPVFWGYGAVAGSYTAIVLVGALLLGIAVRGRSRPLGWYPFAAATLLAVGTGYRPDIGVLWLPIFLVILWQHRWRRAILAGALFTVLNLSWIGAMLHDVGGWERYRGAAAEFGHQAGAMNSFWHLGWIDGPARYAVKLGMGLAWTLGPALIFVPRGFARLLRFDQGGFLAALIVLSMMPALAFHLLIHFGVPGYSFHYLPALLVLIALGIGPRRSIEEAATSAQDRSISPHSEVAVARLLGVAAMMAALFWFYPTNAAAPGWRGDFDLAFCRFTRIGLASPILRVPTHWRTANSRDLAGKTLSDPSSDLSRQ